MVDLFYHELHKARIEVKLDGIRGNILKYLLLNQLNLLPIPRSLINSR